MMKLRHFWQTSWMAVVCAKLLLGSALSNLVEDAGHVVGGSREESWQGCDAFQAPSTTGWGVFAARDFAAGEAVEIVPLAIPITDDRFDGVYKSSVLDDYIYHYNRIKTGEETAVVSFGHAMFFNHHPNPNLVYQRVGDEDGYTLAYVAKQDVMAGEQFFSSYGHEDGGIQWFQHRSMAMLAPEESRISSDNLPSFVAEFCSKIYSGFGLSLPNSIAVVDDGRLAPFAAGLGDVRAKGHIEKGSRIEVGPGLLVSKELFEGSILGSLIISWDQLDEKQKTTLRILRESGQLKVQHQGYDTGWKRDDKFTSCEDLSILPVSGGMGMVRRVGKEKGANCHLNILWQTGRTGDISVTLEMIATEEIEPGQTLLLDLPSSGTSKNLKALKEVLDEMGMPYFQGLFPDDATTTTETMGEL